jgi:hypothetical protein
MGDHLGALSSGTSTPIDLEVLDGSATEEEVRKFRVR